jgi:hypothetical protein
MNILIFILHASYLTKVILAGLNNVLITGSGYFISAEASSLWNVVYFTFARYTYQPVT